MARPPRDMAASVRARLFNLSREREQDFQRVLVSYGLERVLYRLSISEHRDQYILKGGMLVSLWTIDPGRFTQDVDFLVFGQDDEERFLADFTAILGQEVDDLKKTNRKYHYLFPNRLKIRRNKDTFFAAS